MIPENGGKKLAGKQGKGGGVPKGQSEGQGQQGGGGRGGVGGIVRGNLLPPFIVCQEMSSTVLFYAVHKD